LAQADAAAALLLHWLDMEGHDTREQQSLSELEAVAALVCDAATVEPLKIPLIGHWAAKHAKWPRPDKLQEFMKLIKTDSLGLHAVANRCFDIGDLLLKEDAVLRIPDLPMADRGQLERMFGPKAPFVAPAVSIDWPKVSNEVIEATLKLFWAHPLMDVGRQSRSVTENLQMCERLRQWKQSLQQRWDAPDILRFLHIVDLNIHRDDEEPGNANYTGLFVLGSKFSHSCEPNSSWSFSKDGCLQYHAIRPIAKGEPFTFSYIGNGMNMVVSTLLRRRRLGSLWFVCQCSRCSEPDLVRRMSCPKCGAAECLPVYTNGHALAPEWTSKQSPLQELVPDAKLWQCSACGVTASAEELPLEAEEELGEHVVRAMQGPLENVAEDAAALLQLRKQSRAKLGDNHWTTVLATFAWLQKSYVLLRRAPIIDFSEADLQRACSAVASWLQVAAAKNLEQQLSALFIALRLAQNLGGGLGSWGYDPTDPLGNGFASARLSVHGWKICADSVEGPDETANENMMQGNG